MHDEVILTLPFYFNHEMATRMLGCRSVCVPTDMDYQLLPDAIRNTITGETRAVVTISPNNPSGVIYQEESLRDINALCRDKLQVIVKVRDMVLNELDSINSFCRVPPSEGAFSLFLLIETELKRHGRYQGVDIPSPGNRDPGQFIRDG